MGWLTNNKYLPLNLLLFIIIVSSGFSSTAQASGSPVLLTFDAEDNLDAIAIRDLNISEPASYFFTGQFIEEHRRLVAELSRTNTIGSHSYGHAHLKELDQTELRKELLLGKLILEEVTGKAAEWFRAPYLEYNEDVMKMLKELGFRYDSSDMERWVQQTILLELPISTQDGSDKLASDYDLFTADKLSDAAALAWLKRLYDERAITGRPLVFLLHPRIIAPHKQVLFDFMDYVRENKGEFISADQWMERNFVAKPGLSATWIDLSLGQHNTAQIVSDVKKAGMTDVYLMARDPEGKDFFRSSVNTAQSATDQFGEITQALKLADIRVHAWLPVYRNPRLAQQHPDWAMKASNGTVSLEWLSPSNPEVSYSLRETVKLLVSNYNIDGIHLDYFRYPDLAHDFSETAVTAFKQSQNLQEVTTDQLLNDLYTKWTHWRASEIERVAGEIKAVMQAYGGAGIQLSAALIADAALHYRSHEKFAQDYSQLAKQVDLMIPMAYFKEGRKPISWINEVKVMSRFRIGNKPLLLGISAYQKPGEWTLSQQELSESLELAKQGSDGIVIYPYLYLFGHGDPDWSMPTGSAELLHNKLQLNSSNYIMKKPTSVSIPAPVTEIISTEPALSYPTPQTEKPWLFALTAVAALLLLLLISIKLWQKSLAGITTTPRSNAQTSNGTEKTYKDWKALSVDIKNDLVDANIFSQVSELLHEVGASNIANFRLVRVLDEISDMPRELTDVVMACSGLYKEKASGLRFIEESILLDYAKIKGSKVHIMPHGKQFLEQWRTKGYSKDYTDFLETRLSETIVLTCPNCDSQTLGHWFWKQFECGNCNHNFEFTEASKISRKGDETSHAIHSLYNTNNAKKFSVVRAEEGE